MQRSPDADVASLALEEARRALTYQAGSVDELRSRTGLLLATAAITASLLGSAAESKDGLEVLGIAAVFFFAVGIAGSIWVLLPRVWIFATSPKVLLGDEWAEHARAGDVRPHLARYLDEHYEKNKVQFERLVLGFQLAARSVGAAVILSSLELTATG